MRCRRFRCAPPCRRILRFALFPFFQNLCIRCRLVRHKDLCRCQKVLCPAFFGESGRAPAKANASVPPLPPLTSLARCDKLLRITTQNKEDAYAPHPHRRTESLCSAGRGVPVWYCFLTFPCLGKSFFLPKIRAILRFAVPYGAVNMVLYTIE